MPKLRKVILGVCGSVAAYKAGDLIRRLQEKDCAVSVVMTKEAQRFITPLTLGALSGTDVYTDMFDGEDKAWKMPHIELARQADVVLIAPATANILAKIAHGMADDLLSTMVLTTRAPLVIAPAMNDEMYANAMVQDNCAKLKKHGVKFVEPAKGKLACGVVGVGHLAEIDDIIKAVLKA
jgi:phosphopantothenoylcysteine decarboxylase/phosphopantothenate--cysteine ligase